MAKKEKQKLNLLDCTPIREPDLKWTENENGTIELTLKHATPEECLSTAEYLKNEFQENRPHIGLPSADMLPYISCHDTQSGSNRP